MVIYSYTPERGDKISRALIYSLAGAGLVLAAAAEIFTSASSVLHVTAFALMLGSILVWSRCMLSFTYSLESPADGTPPDLVIVENRGKASRTVCRISASGGNLFRYDKKKHRQRLSQKKIYDYRPTPFCGSYVYEVPERDGGGFVIFCPDEKMIALMQSLGCRVDE